MPTLAGLLDDGFEIKATSVLPFAHFVQHCIFLQKATEKGTDAYAVQINHKLDGSVIFPISVQRLDKFNG